MSEDPDIRRHGTEGPAPDRPHAGRPHDLPGLEPPPFDAPLVAFDPAPGGAPGSPVYLGGDLHRVHSVSAARDPARVRDGSLDDARIALFDRENEELGTTAVEGVWCLALHGELVDSAPYFTLRDAEERLRAWLILPPPRLMIGIAHLWFPSVPPAPTGG